MQAARTVAVQLQLPDRCGYTVSFKAGLRPIEPNQRKWVTDNGYVHALTRKAPTRLSPGESHSCLNREPGHLQPRIREESGLRSEIGHNRSLGGSRPKNLSGGGPLKGFWTAPEQPRGRFWPLSGINPDPSLTLGCRCPDTRLKRQSPVASLSLC